MPTENPQTSRAMISKRTSRYMKLLRELPEEIQQMADELFKVFQKNRHDPLLQSKVMKDSSSGRHRKGSISTRITIGYRAVYVIDNGVSGKEEPQCCWYWVGSRESFSVFAGCR